MMFGGSSSSENLFSSASDALETQSVSSQALFGPSDVESDHGMPGGHFSGGEELGGGIGGGGGGGGGIGIPGAVEVRQKYLGKITAGCIVIETGYAVERVNFDPFVTGSDCTISDAVGTTHHSHHHHHHHPHHLSSLLQQHQQSSSSNNNNNNNNTIPRHKGNNSAFSSRGGGGVGIGGGGGGGGGVIDQNALLSVEERKKAMLINLQQRHFYIKPTQS